MLSQVSVSLTVGGEVASGPPGPFQGGTPTSGPRFFQSGTPPPRQDRGAPPDTGTSNAMLQDNTSLAVTQEDFLVLDLKRLFVFLSERDKVKAECYRGGRVYCSFITMLPVVSCECRIEMIYRACNLSNRFYGEILTMLVAIVRVGTHSLLTCGMIGDIMTLEPVSLRSLQRNIKPLVTLR